MKTKNKSFTLTILKKDLETASFINCCDCPIARSIKRKGANLDGNKLGVDIFNLDFEYKKNIFNISGSKYENLSNKVQYMMDGSQKPKTFSIKLNATIVK